MKSILLCCLLLTLSGCGVYLSVEERQALYDSTDAAYQNAVASKAPIFVYRIGPSEPNSAGGVSVTSQMRIISEKPIKYIRLDVVPFNAVGDSVTSEIGRKRDAFLNMTGPFTKGQFQYPYWKNIWYNNTISCVTINSVLVTYMDDSRESFGIARGVVDFTGESGVVAQPLDLVLSKSVPKNCKPQF